MISSRALSILLLSENITMRCLLPKRFFFWAIEAVGNAVATFFSWTCLPKFLYGKQLEWILMEMSDKEKGAFGVIILNISCQTYALLVLNQTTAVLFIYGRWETDLKWLCMFSTQTIACLLQRLSIAAPLDAFQTFLSPLNHPKLLVHLYQKHVRDFSPCNWAKTLPSNEVCLRALARHQRLYEWISSLSIKFVKGSIHTIIQ